MPQHLHLPSVILFILIRRACLLFLLIFSTSYLSASAQTPVKTHYTGIATGWILHYPDSLTERIVSGCARTGAGYIRIDFPWPDIQRYPDEIYEWDKLDRIIHIINQNGLKVIAVIGYFPSWTRRDKIEKEWYRFVYQAAKRYIPKGVDVWELYNEPNCDFFYKNPDPAHYVRHVLIPGSLAIRQASRECFTPVTILTGGTAPVSSDGKNISPVDFIRGIYMHGGRPYFDALAVHPYTWPFDPLQEREQNWFLKTKQIYDIMQTFQDGSKKIWATEIGFPTGGGGVHEDTQSHFMIKSFQAWFSEKWAGPLIWYSFYDRGEKPHDPEDHFGLIYHNWKPKPAYHTFIRLVQKFNSAKPAE